MKAQIIPIPIFLAMITVSTNAQAQDRVYPIPELTDEMREKIDLTDGSIEEWVEILGEPSLTPLDFQLASWASTYSEPSLGVVEFYVTPFESPDLGGPGPKYGLQSFLRENDRVQYPDTGADIHRGYLSCSTFHGALPSPSC